MVKKMNKKIICIGLVGLLALMATTNTVYAAEAKNVSEVGNKIIKVKLIELLSSLHIIVNNLEIEYEYLLMEGFLPDDHVMEVISYAMNEFESAITSVEEMLDNIDEWTVFELKDHVYDLYSNLCTFEVTIEYEYEQLLNEGHSPDEHPMEVISYAMSSLDSVKIKVQIIISLIPDITPNIQL